MATQGEASEAVSEKPIQEETVELSGGQCSAPLQLLKESSENSLDVEEMAEVGDENSMDCGALIRTVKCSIVQDSSEGNKIVHSIDLGNLDYSEGETFTEPPSAVQTSLVEISKYPDAGLDEKPFEIGEHMLRRETFLQKDQMGEREQKDETTKEELSSEAKEKDTCDATTIRQRSEEWNSENECTKIHENAHAGVLVVESSLQEGKNTENGSKRVHLERDRQNVEIVSKSEYVSIMHDVKCASPTIFQAIHEINEKEQESIDSKRIAESRVANNDGKYITESDEVTSLEKIEMGTDTNNAEPNEAGDRKSLTENEEIITTECPHVTTEKQALEEQLYIEENEKEKYVYSVSDKHILESTSACNKTEAKLNEHPNDAWFKVVAEIIETSNRTNDENLEASFLKLTSAGTNFTKEQAEEKPKKHIDVLLEGPRIEAIDEQRKSGKEQEILVMNSDLPSVKEAMEETSLQRYEGEKNSMKFPGLDLEDHEGEYGENENKSKEQEKEHIVQMTCPDNTSVVQESGLTAEQLMRDEGKNLQDYSCVASEDISPIQFETVKDQDNAAQEREEKGDTSVHESSALQELLDKSVKNDMRPYETDKASDMDLEKNTETGNTITIKKIESESCNEENDTKEQLSAHVISVKQEHEDCNILEDGNQGKESSSGQMRMKTEDTCTGVTEKNKNLHENEEQHDEHRNISNFIVSHDENIQGDENKTKDTEEESIQTDDAVQQIEKISEKEEMSDGLKSKPVLQANDENITNVDCEDEKVEEALYQASEGQCPEAIEAYQQSLQSDKYTDAGAKKASHLVSEPPEDLQGSQHSPEVALQNYERQRHEVQELSNSQPEEKTSESTEVSKIEEEKFVHTTLLTVNMPDETFQNDETVDECEATFWRPGENESASVTHLTEVEHEEYHEASSMVSKHAARSTNEDSQNLSCSGTELYVEDIPEDKELDVETPKSEDRHLCTDHKLDLDKKDTETTDAGKTSEKVIVQGGDIVVPHENLFFNKNQGIRTLAGDEILKEGTADARKFEASSSAQSTKEKCVLNEEEENEKLAATSEMIQEEDQFQKVMDLHKDSQVKESDKLKEKVDEQIPDDQENKRANDPKDENITQEKDLHRSIAILPITCESVKEKLDEEVDIMQKEASRSDTEEAINETTSIHMITETKCENIENPDESLFLHHDDDVTTDRQSTENDTTNYDANIDKSALSSSIIEQKENKNKDGEHIHEEKEDDRRERNVEMSSVGAAEMQVNDKIGDRKYVESAVPEYGWTDETAAETNIQVLEASKANYMKMLTEKDPEEVPQKNESSTNKLEKSSFAATKELEMATEKEHNKYVQEGPFVKQERSFQEEVRVDRNLERLVTDMNPRDQIEKMVDHVELDKAEETKTVYESDLHDKVRNLPIIQQLATLAMNIDVDPMNAANIAKREEKTDDVTRENEKYRRDLECEKDMNDKVTYETGVAAIKNSALSASQTTEEKIAKKVVLPVEAQIQSKKLETSESRDDKKLEEEGTNKEVSASISQQNLLEEERVENVHVLTSMEGPEIVAIEEAREKQENSYTTIEEHSNTLSKVLEMHAEDVNSEKQIINKVASKDIYIICTGQLMLEQSFEQAEIEDKPNEEACDKPRDVGIVNKKGQEFLKMSIPNEKVESDWIPVVQDLKEATDKEYAKDTTLEPETQITKISSQEDQHNGQSSEHGREDIEDKKEERTMILESMETLVPNGQSDEQTGQLSMEQTNPNERAQLVEQKTQNGNVKLNSETMGNVTNEDKEMEVCSLSILSAPAEQRSEEGDLKAKPDEEEYENTPGDVGKLTETEDYIVEMSIPNEKVESECIHVVQGLQETTDKESAKDIILETDSQTTKISSYEDQSYIQSSQHREILYTVSSEGGPASVHLQGNQRNTENESNASTVEASNCHMVETKIEATVQTEPVKIELSEDDETRDKSDESQNDETDGSYEENRETFLGSEASKVIISSHDDSKDKETSYLPSPQEWDYKDYMTLSEAGRNIHVEKHTGDTKDNQEEEKMTAEPTETLEPEVQSDQEAGQLRIAEQKDPNEEVQSDKEPGQLNSEMVLNATNKEKEVEVCSLCLLSAPAEQTYKEVEIKAEPEKEACENNLSDLGKETKKIDDIVEMDIPHEKVESDSIPEVQGFKETTDEESAKDKKLENDSQTTKIGSHEDQDYGQSFEYGEVEASNFQKVQIRFEATVETEPVKIESPEDDRIHGKLDENQNNETTRAHEENHESFSGIEASNIKISLVDDRKVTEAGALSYSQELDDKNSCMTLYGAEKHISVENKPEYIDDKRNEGKKTDGSTEALEPDGQSDELTGQLRTSEEKSPNEDAELNSEKMGHLTNEENQMEVCSLSVLSAPVEQRFEEIEKKNKPEYEYEYEACENKLRDPGKITKKADDIVKMDIPGEKVEYGCIPVVQGLKETTDEESAKDVILQSDNQSTKISSHEDQRCGQSSEHGEVLHTISSEEESLPACLQGNQRNTVNESNVATTIRIEDQQVETSSFQMVETKFEATAETEPIKIDLSEDNPIHDQSDQNQNNETPASYEENHDTFSGTKACEVKISSSDDSKAVEAGGLSSSQDWDDKNSHVSLSEAEKNIHVENHTEDTGDNLEGMIKAESTEALEPQSSGQSDEQARQLGTAEQNISNEDVKLDAETTENEEKQAEDCSLSISSAPMEQSNQKKVEGCEKLPEPNIKPISSFQMKEIMTSTDGDPRMNVHLSSHANGSAEEITSDQMDAWKNGTSYDHPFEGPNNLNCTLKEDSISSAADVISHAENLDGAKDFKTTSVDSLSITINDSTNPKDESSASVDPTSQGEATVQEEDGKEQEENFSLTSSEKTVQNTNSNEDKESNRKPFEHNLEVMDSSEEIETKESWDKGQNKSLDMKLPADGTTSAGVSDKFERLNDSPLEVPEENIISNNNKIEPMTVKICAKEDLVHIEKLDTVYASSVPIISDVASAKDELCQETPSIKRATELEGEAILHNEDREKQNVDFNMSALSNEETVGNASFHKVTESDNMPDKHSPEVAVSAEMAEIKEIRDESTYKEVHVLSASEVSNEESEFVEAKDVIKKTSAALLEGPTHEDITSDEQNKSFSLEAVNDASHSAEAQKVETPSSRSALTNINSVIDQEDESFSNVGHCASMVKKDMEGVMEYDEDTETQLEVSNVMFKEQISGIADSHEKIMSEKQSQFLPYEQVSVEEKPPVEGREVMNSMKYENRELSTLNTPQNEEKQMGISYLPVSQFLIDRIMREEDDKSQITIQEEGTGGGCEVKNMKQQDRSDLSSGKKVEAIEEPKKPGNAVSLIVEDQSSDAQEFTSTNEENPKRNTSGFSLMETLLEDAKIGILVSEKLTHIVPKEEEKHATSEKSETQSEVKNKENPSIMTDEKNNCAAEVTVQKAILNNNEALTKNLDTPSVEKTNRNKILQEGSQKFVEAKEIQTNIEMCEKATIEDHVPETIVVTDTLLNTQNPTQKSSSPVVEAEPVPVEALEFETEGKEVKTQVDDEQDGRTAQMDSMVEGPIKEIKLSDAGKVQPSDFEKDSMDENNQMAENILEEESLAINNVELNKEKIDEKLEEEKTDGEEDGKDEELEVNKAATDASVIVEAREEAAKSAHKKSHNILAGVKSKVKHSIAKVKKAITGKSSQSKMMPPK